MKCRRIASFGCLAVCASLLGACGSKSDVDADLEAVPEQAAFALSVTDDAASEGSGAAADAIDPASEVGSSMDALSAALSENVAPELANARAPVRSLNQALHRFMEPIVALVRDREPTTSAGRVRVWGPIVRGATEFRFALRHGTLRHYGWLLEARAAGTDDAFTRVAAGGISVGFAARRGTGTLGIDLDALGSVDPTVVARGALVARFAHGAAGSIVGYRLRDFVGETGTQPITALVHGVHIRGGGNRLRLAYQGNLPESGTEASEFVLARVRYQRAVGGRADLLVTGGDVPPGKVWLVSECWNAALAAGFRSVRDCPGDGLGGERCQLLASSGDASSCVGSFDEPEFAPSDPEAAMHDSQSPEGDVMPPDSMPDGTPPTGV
jgi:hypothetical protein